MEAVGNIELRESVSREAFETILMRRLLFRHGDYYTHTIANTFKQNGEEFFKDKLEPFCNQAKEDSDEGISNKGYKPLQEEFVFVSTKGDDGKSIAIEVFSRNYAKNREMFEKVAQIPVTEKDVSEKGMDELEKITDYISFQKEALATDLADKAR